MRHPVAPDRLPPAAGPGGLDDDEVASRRQRFGANTLLAAAPNDLPALLKAGAGDPMLWFLVLTATLYALLGERIEAAVLLAATVPLFGMDIFLHRRVQASTGGLAARLASEAEVLRGGRRRTVAAEALVPGDRVVVTAGEYVPADGIVVEGQALQVDESTLSGESLPQRKRPLPDAAVAVSVAHEHWMSAGTRLLTGEAQLQVVDTGADTTYGGIVRSALLSRSATTPLQQAIAHLVGVLLVVAAGLCVLLAAARLVQGFGWIDALLSAVTLAVAALPEEFPVVFTTFLGVGVYRLARRRALVRRAVVVENIGRVDFICTDKTGTLTEGRLQLQHLLPADGVDEPRLLRAAATASHAAGGDPMDEAILTRTPAVRTVASFPFTEGRRSQIGVAESPTGRRAAVKGAPETVLAMSTLDAAARADWLARVAVLADDGHKVIACAERPLADGDEAEPVTGFGFLGLLAFEDPLRPGVADAVAQAQSAGIRVVMISGDHPRTARAIAAEIGIGDGEPRVIDGGELRDALARGELPDVVARCLPAQKLELVQALQRDGAIVAVTGDGINDVPALRGADVGIAMAERGTRGAREAASIVLLDDDFASIVQAVAEGRQLFSNLRRSFAFLLVVHVPLVLTAALIPLAGYPLLYLPISIVWLELVIHPAALLAFQQPAEPGAIGPPQPRSARFFDRREWAWIAGSGLALAAWVGAAFLLTLASASVELARSVAFASLLAALIGSAAVLSGLRTAAARAVVLAAALSTGLLFAVPALSTLLHLEPLSRSAVLVACAAGGLAALLMRGLRGGGAAATRAGR